MDLEPVLHDFLPKGIWLRRTVALSAFIFFDYLVTIILCKHPANEGNLLARGFMQNYGIVLGLTYFDLLMTTPIYVILCVDSYFIKSSTGHSTLTGLFTDVGLGWIVAGAHFDGAISWLSEMPAIVGQLTGLVLYVLIVTFPSINRGNTGRYLVCHKS